MSAHPINPLKLLSSVDKHPLRENTVHFSSKSMSTGGFHLCSLFAPVQASHDAVTALLIRVKLRSAHRRHSESNGVQTLLDAIAPATLPQPGFGAEQADSEIVA
jgi:hypothetical protein